MKVSENCLVKMNYSIELPDGRIVDSTDDSGPMEFITGLGQVVPVLEQNVQGMEPGQKKVFETGPAEAFGERDPEAFRKVSRDELDQGDNLKEGMMFRVHDENAGALLITVVSVDDQEVLFDLNHPLAGTPLKFSVEVLDVNEAPRGGCSCGCSCDDEDDCGGGGCGDGCGDGCH